MKLRVGLIGLALALLLGESLALSPKASAGSDQTQSTRSNGSGLSFARQTIESHGESEDRSHGYGRWACDHNESDWRESIARELCDRRCEEMAFRSGSERNDGNS